MKNNHLDVIVMFAKLWGITLADNRTDKAICKALESYDSEELAELLSKWAEEFVKKEFAQDGYVDACDFFDEKMSALISHEKNLSLSDRYPVLLARAGEISRELHNIQEVAEFIIEQGTTHDVNIVTTGGAPFISTFGIFLNSIADEEYRTELLKVLVPMQYACERKNITEAKPNDSN